MNQNTHTYTHNTKWIQFFYYYYATSDLFSYQKRILVIHWQQTIVGGTHLSNGTGACYGSPQQEIAYLERASENPNDQHANAPSGRQWQGSAGNQQTHPSTT